MILKCKLCKQRCHQTKSFGHSPSRQIWRPCSAHAPCPPPPRSPWLPPSGLPGPRGRGSPPTLAPLCGSWRAARPGRRAGGEPGAREGRPGAAAAPFPEQTPLPGTGCAGSRRVPLMLPPSVKPSRDVQPCVPGTWLGVPPLACPPQEQKSCTEAPQRRDGEPRWDLGAPPLLELGRVRVELHVGALVVVAAAGLVDVVGLHLVGPVHLAGFLVLPVQPAGGQWAGPASGRVGSWAHPDAGHSQPPDGRGASSADGGPRGAGLALDVQAPWPPPPAQCPFPALCSWLWPETVCHLLEPQGRVSRPPAYSGLRGRGTGLPRGQLWRPPRPTESGSRPA